MYVTVIYKESQSVCLPLRVSVIRSGCVSGGVSPVSVGVVVAVVAVGGKGLSKTQTFHLPFQLPYSLSFYKIREKYKKTKTKRQKQKLVHSNSKCYKVARKRDIDCGLKWLKKE